ncbi:hypothetical protein TcBrA4_0045720 [Trypanosoma cruzi]|nr:hypothetical protein TcBrA4_0045720 [Trypanosoma cruzi]
MTRSSFRSSWRRGRRRAHHAQEEYDALKSFVDNSLKPLISRLKRTNGEKELDLRANEERIRQLLHDKEQLQSSWRRGRRRAHQCAGGVRRAEEFCGQLLKPLISRLKRTNGEKELDLRANEERIRQLLHDKEQLQKQLRRGRRRAASMRRRSTTR